MKKHLVFALILTIIFPAYCFVNPILTFPTEQEVLEQIMLIIEDGEVEEEEIVSFIAMGYEDEITISQIDYECLFILSTVALITLLLIQLDFVGGSGEILLDAFLMFGGFSYLVLIYLGLGEFGGCYFYLY